MNEASFCQKSLRCFLHCLANVSNLKPTLKLFIETLTWFKCLLKAKGLLSISKPETILVMNPFSHLLHSRLLPIWHWVGTGRKQPPEPSGVERTYVGSILTLALSCISRQRPRFISFCILLLTSIRWSSFSRNFDRI